MKAWNELETHPDVSLYWTGDSRNPTSYWYLDHGIKIERFEDDGRIEINNAMTKGDNYETVTESEFSVFDRDGWLAGCYNVNINTINSKLDKLNVYIKSTKNMNDMDLLMERKGVLINKRNRYYELSEKLQIFAN
jgi:hypothetical protein